MIVNVLHTVYGTMTHCNNTKLSPFFYDEPVQNQPLALNLFLDSKIHSRLIPCQLLSWTGLITVNQHSANYPNHWELLVKSEIN